MTTKSKTDLTIENATLRSELKAYKTTQIVEGVISVLKEIIRWGTIAYCAHQLATTLMAYAGKATYADVGILADLRLSFVLAWTAAGGGVAYGWRQRKLRRDVVERLQKRNQELERDLDPNRSSSNLDPRGNTREEDKL